MDITNFLSYLKEELKDIPANPDNIHYTNFESLYYILQTGLMGQDYAVKTPAAHDGVELATVRNSHKPTQAERSQLSLNVESGGVKIELFTDRIKAGHRGTKVRPIAELPIQTQRYIERWEDEFTNNYKMKIPKLFKKGTDLFSKKSSRESDEDLIKLWLRRNGYIPKNRIELDRWVRSIYDYNHELWNLDQELKNREREERFILKKNIPINPIFMRIVIEKNPKEMNYKDDEFCEEVAAGYITLIKEHDDVFLHNKNFREFKKYLREKIK